MKSNNFKNKWLVTFALCAALAVIAGATACSAGSKNGSEETEEAADTSVGSSEEASDSSVGKSTEDSSEDRVSEEGNGEVASTAAEDMALKITDKDRDTSYSEEDSKRIELTDDTGTVRITEEGTYVVTGSSDNGMIIIDASEEADVHLVLRDCTLISPTSAAVYVLSADDVYITLEGTNTLGNGGSYVAIDENDIDAVLFAKDDLTMNGSGTLNIDASTGHAIVCKDELVITGGTYDLKAADDAINSNDSLAITDGSFAIECGDDAIHTDGILQIDGGTYDIEAAEGLEATYITINDGTIAIHASDDGINAAQKVDDYSPALIINGGSITIDMDQGDTDGIDSNGDLYINGGVIDITAQSAIDYDGEAVKSGGTLIINGQETEKIPNQMMGGPGGGNGQFPDGQFPDGQFPDGQFPDGQFPGGRDQQEDPFRDGRKPGREMA